MSKIEELRAKLIEFFRTVQEDLEVQATPGKVLSVDEDARTCEVEPASAPGAPVTAGLQPIQSSEVGLVQIPEEGSRVIIDWITEDHAVVVLCSKVTRVLLDCEEITINGGDNGKMSIYDELKKELKKEKQRVDLLYDAINNSATASQDGGATYKENMKLVLTIAQEPDYDRSEITDDKIKH